MTNNCIYEVPNWVNLTVQEDVKEFAEDASKAEELPHTKNARIAMSKVVSSTSNGSILSEGSRVYGNSFTGSSVLQEKPVIEPSDKFNFASTYYLYVFRNSSVADIKALAPYALQMRDIYQLHFYIKFLVDYKAVKYLIVSMYQNKVRKTKQKDVSKVAKEHLDALKLFMSKINKKNEFASLLHSIMQGRRKYNDALLNDRQDIVTMDLSRHGFGKNGETVFGGMLNNPFFSFDRLVTNGKDMLIERILAMLPVTKIIKYLWKQFSLYVYPFIPIFNLVEFSKEVSEILVGLNLEDIFENDTSNEMKRSNWDRKVEYVKINQNLDFGKLATFLTALRFGFLAIKNNLNQTDCCLESFVLENGSKEIISSDFIDLSQLCLNFLKFQKKSSYVVVTALTMLYYYAEWREESRTGFEMNQNHILLALVLCEAREVGLNKDWTSDVLVEFFRSLTSTKSSKNHFSGSETEIYRMRKLWYFLVNMDSHSAVSNGSILNVQSDEEYDTKFPDPDIFLFAEQDFGEINIVSHSDLMSHDELLDDPIVSGKSVEAVICKNMKVDYEAGTIFRELSRLVNNFKHPVSIQTLVDILARVESRNSVDDNYFIEFRANSNDVVENYYQSIDYIQRLKAHFNIKYVAFYISFMLYLYFDTQHPGKITGQNNSMYFLKKTSFYAFNSIGLVKNYIIHNKEIFGLQGEQKGFKNFNFTFLPTLDMICSQHILLFHSLLIRTAHCLCNLQLQVNKFQQPDYLKGTTSFPELVEKIALWKGLYVSLYQYYYRLVKFLIDKFAKLYSHSYRATVKYQYYMISFNDPRQTSETMKQQGLRLQLQNYFVAMKVQDVIALKDHLEGLIASDAENFPDNFDDNLVAKYREGDESTKLISLRTPRLDYFEQNNSRSNAPSGNGVTMGYDNQLEIDDFYQDLQPSYSGNFDGAVDGLLANFDVNAFNLDYFTGDLFYKENGFFSM